MNEVTGYAIRDGCIVDSAGNIRTKPPFIEFLLSGNGTKVFLNLKYDMAELAKLLRLSSKEAAKLQRTGTLYLTPHYSLKYVPGKFMSIRDLAHGQFVSFADMSNYRDVYIDNPLEAARLAEDIALEAASAFEQLGLDTSSLVSPVRAFEKSVLSKMSLPTVDDLPDEVGFYAAMCARGSWIEAHKLGHFPTAYEYDVNSCYGYFTAHLPDTRKGKWIHSRKYEPKAELGYIRGTLIIDSSLPNPIIYKKSGRNFSPRGTWTTYLTKKQLEFVVVSGLGDFIIEDGYWWIPEEKEYPLRDVMYLLYEKKVSSRGIAQQVAKQILAGTWGKFLERRGESTGELFNPVWGAEVETSAGLHVARFIHYHRLADSLIHVTVDGVLLDRKVNIDSTDMGGWRLSEVGPVIVVSSGAVAHSSSCYCSDLSLSYQWLRTQIEENPHTTEYVIYSRRPVTIGLAIAQDKWDKLGTEETITRTISVDAEIKRFYPKRPQCGEDLLHNTFTSEPWDISFLESAEIAPKTDELDW